MPKGPVKHFSLAFRLQDILAFVLCCVLFQPLLAQPPNTIPSRVDFSNEEEEQGDEELLDNKLEVEYFFNDNPGLVFPLKDTLMHNFQQYDPIRTGEIDFAHLGNLGSAHQPLLYQTPFKKGLDIGLHQYDLYYLTPQDIPYYKIQKAFSKLFYSQGGSQREGFFKGQFGRNFANNVSLSLEYHRLNNEGKYRFQKSLNSAFTSGVWYNSANGKYDLYASYTYNEIRQKENGGIDLDLLSSPLPDNEFEILVPLTEDVQTRFVNRHFNLLQTFNFSGKPDTLNTQPNRAYLLSHEFDFSPSSYKFYDDIPAADSSYYGPLQIDNRAVRYLIRQRSIQNTFKIITRKSGADEKSQKDLLEVGLSHALHFVNHEPRDTILNDLFLQGRWHFSPSENFKVKTYAHLALWNQAGDFRLEGRLLFNLPKIGSLEAHAISQAYAPSLIANRLLITGQEVWDNNFNKTFETKLGGTLTIPAINLKITGQYNLITDLIYFDTLSFARQADEVVNVLQLRLDHKLKLGNFFFNNQVTLQETTGDVLRLPSLYSKHSLYVQFKIFRSVLNVQSGLDLRFNTAYFANTYQPLTGQFHQQARIKNPIYPALDAFFNIQVDRLRFFIKMENLTKFVREDLYYQTALYPNPYAAIRLGAGWILLN